MGVNVDFAWVAAAIKSEFFFIFVTKNKFIMSKYNDGYEIFAVFRTTSSDPHANAEVLEFFNKPKIEVVNRVDLKGLQNLVEFVQTIK